MKALTYQLRLWEPVLVSQAGSENSAIGLPFVPGSVLRGAVVTHYLARHNLADLAADPEARALFLDGTVVFLNAYPDLNEQRLLPTPRSWFTEGDLAGEDTGTLYDWAVDNAQPLKQSQPPKRATFCILTAPGTPPPGDKRTLGSLTTDKETELPRVQFYTPAREISRHMALVNRSARTADNQVYCHEALAAGEVLAGAIVAPDDFDLSSLHTLLAENPDLFLGKAHTAGYGHVSLIPLKIVEQWQEYPISAPLGDRVVVTLLSDTILRGPDGQYSADLDYALVGLLGLSDLSALSRYQRVRLVGGFNRKWGMPLEQTWAIQAGSVFVYPAAQVDADRLRSLIVNGLGERRAEGFGRIAVNWHTANRMTWQQLKCPIPASECELSAGSRALAQRMARRHLENLLEQGLVAAVDGIRITRPPQNTQLSRVRKAARQALLRQNLQPLSAHLAALKGAREQFERAGVAGISMLTWLHARLGTRDIQQQLLSDTVLTPIAGVPMEITPELQIHYTARLIDGVMKKAIRQNQAEEENV